MTSYYLTVPYCIAERERIMDRITGIADQIIETILMNIEIKTARTIVRIVGGIFLLIVCIWSIVAIYNRVSSQKELRRWEETTAVVKESVTEGESLSPLMSQYVNNNHTNWYKVYTIWYTIVAEGYAWGIPYVFEYSDSNSGNVSEYTFELPAYAYYSFPQEGDVISLIFDPDDFGAFRVGTIEEWKQDKATHSRILTPIIFVSLILVLAFFDIRIKSFENDN